MLERLREAKNSLMNVPKSLMNLQTRIQRRVLKFKVNLRAPLCLNGVTEASARHFISPVKHLKVIEMSHKTLASILATA